MAVTIGNVSSPVCQGQETNMRVVIKNLATSWSLGQNPDSYPDSLYGEELEYIAGVMQSSSFEN